MRIASMNDKETVLMLEAQIRRYQELLKDPESRIRALEAKHAAELRVRDSRIGRLAAAIRDLERKVDHLSHTPEPLRCHKEIRIVVEQPSTYSGPDWPGIL
jgi:predicted RNase H-like nuclease (RuvC/YqgF family)